MEFVSVRIFKWVLMVVIYLFLADALGTGICIVQHCACKAIHSEIQCDAIRKKFTTIDINVV